MSNPSGAGTYGGLAAHRTEVSHQHRSPGTTANYDTRLDELAVLVNRTRVDNAVLPLARSQQLDSAAQAHSLDMVANNYLDHIGSDNSTPQERADRAGYAVPPGSGWIVVEVISAISDEPAGPLNWWLTEATGVHRRVLLNPRWREFGVGYAAGGDYGNYWTLLVGCSGRCQGF